MLRTSGHPARRPSSPGRADIVVAVVAIIATVPYIGLKVAWVAGSTVGQADPRQFATPTYVVANAVSLAMDVLAVALVFALVHPRGRRLPGWLLLPPAWAASGLLLPVLAVFALTGGGVGGGAVTGDGLQPWVYVLVYSCFTVQGAAIATLTVRYIRRRWPALVDRLVVPAGLSWTGLAMAVMLVAAAAALVAVAAFGYHQPTPSKAAHVASAVQAAAAVVAATGGGGVLSIVGRGSTTIPLTSRRTASGRWWLVFAAWFGTGACVMWGGYELAISAVFGGNAVADLPTVTAAVRVVCGSVLAALVMAVVWPASRNLVSCEQSPSAHPREREHGGQEQRPES